MDQNVNTNCAQQIRELRMSARLSQYQLAARAGISRMRISLVECGYATLSTEEDQSLRCAIDCAVREQIERLSAKLETKPSCSEALMLEKLRRQR